jgi:hypothetical protein
MFTSHNEYAKYQAGKIAWGISDEGRKDYPYMRMMVSVHSSEVVGIEQKTLMPDSDYNERRDFISYDIRRLNRHGD